MKLRKLLLIFLLFSLLITKKDGTTIQYTNCSDWKIMDNVLYIYSDNPYPVAALNWSTIFSIARKPNKELDYLASQRRIL